MSHLLHSWQSPEFAPNPHRARELVVARPDQVAGELRLKREMGELGIKRVGGSSLQTWDETLMTSQVDSTALTASTTATSILPPAAAFTLPANYFSIGKALRIRAWGRVSNIVTTPGTLTLDIRFGSLATPIVVFNGGAMTLNVVAKTNVPWQWESLLICRSIGATTTATMFGMGQWTSESVVGSPVPTTGGNGSLLLPVVTPAVGTGFDSTIANVVNFFGTWSLSNANSIQTHLYTLEALN